MSTQIPMMSCNQAPAELGDECPEGMALEAGVCQCELQGPRLEAGFSSMVAYASPDLRATPLRPGDRRRPPTTTTSMRSQHWQRALAMCKRDSV